MADGIETGLENLVIDGAIGDIGDGKVGSKAHDIITCNSTYELKKTVQIFTSQGAPEYNMHHPYRGKAIIFNHEKFDPHLKMNERKGTREDKKTLIDLFETLGFCVSQYDDLTKWGVKSVLEAVSKEDHSKNDCFVCCLLTHGENGIFYAKDNKYANTELWTPFLGKSCPSLAGKPKLFFIQACQGDQVDDGVKVRTLNVSSDSSSIYTIPSHADFLMAFSTVPGYYSWRNTTNGSWFIQALCRVLKSNAATVDLLTLLTQVTYEVAFNCTSHVPSDYAMHSKKQVPCTTTMLTRKVFFPPKTK